MISVIIHLGKINKRSRSRKFSTEFDSTAMAMTQYLLSHKPIPFFLLFPIKKHLFPNTRSLNQLNDFPYTLLSYIPFTNPIFSHSHIMTEPMENTFFNLFFFTPSSSLHTILLSVHSAHYPFLNIQQMF